MGIDYFKEENERFNSYKVRLSLVPCITVPAVAVGFNSYKVRLSLLQCLRLQ